MGGEGLGTMTFTFALYMRESGENSEPINSHVAKGCHDTWENYFPLLFLLLLPPLLFC